MYLSIYNAFPIFNEIKMKKKLLLIIDLRIGEDYFNQSKTKIPWGLLFPLTRTFK